MIGRKELLDWVKAVDPNSSIAVDDGGLALVEIDTDGKQTGNYIEVGGIPDDE